VLVGSLFPFNNVPQQVMIALLKREERRPMFRFPTGFGNNTRPKGSEPTTRIDKQQAGTSIERL